MIDKYLLRIASLNLNETINLIGYYFNEWKLDIREYTVSKDFYMEIEEELDSSVLTTRYKALGKLLVSFLQDVNFHFLYGEDIESNFNKINLNSAFEYGVLHELIRNLFYFHYKFTNDYIKDQVTIAKLTLILFMKLNIYLIFIILYVLRLKKDVKSYIKNTGDELEEITLKLIKISNTHKYIPSRVLLCVHYIYFKILTEESAGEDNELHTCRKIDQQKKFLTKENYIKYLKPKVPLIFVTNDKSNSSIEKFYRKNMLKRDKPDLERVIIVQILKILLSTFENTKSQSSNISEYIKDYIPDLILRKFLLEKVQLVYISEKKEGNDAIDNDGEIVNSDLENKDIDTRAFLEMFNEFPKEDRDDYSIIELINKLSITAVIVCLYYSILKELQLNNLIQYSYFSFHLKDSNGLYVFLRIFKQEFKVTEDQFIFGFERDILSALYIELNDVIMLYNLKLVYKISFKNNEYIYKLVECKVPIMLKKVLAMFDQNQKIKRYCLKLFKCQMKFFDKTWRTENEAILTSIYLTLKVGCDANDNYLERKDKNVKEVNSEFFNEEELKKIYQEFHETNYLFYLNNPNEYEKYINGFYSSNYSQLYQRLEQIANEQLNPSTHLIQTNTNPNTNMNMNMIVIGNQNNYSSSGSPKINPKGKENNNQVMTMISGSNIPLNNQESYSNLTNNSGTSEGNII